MALEAFLLAAAVGADHGRQGPPASFTDDDDVWQSRRFSRSLGERNGRHLFCTEARRKTIGANVAMDAEAFCMGERRWSFWKGLG
jgi:hypothetical protein